ncbi:DUF257 family protein [Thermococcus gammatolerans]|uniref:DUF257 family protein n=1 Tax=Thermococcus gammatolerans TaxID=187878 RepID=UPI001EE5D35C|nr:DUF257 family protein [Thermococcus gammatolerans]
MRYLTKLEISLGEFVGRLKPGEDVLVEYSSTTPVHILFYRFLRALANLGKPFMILDELDQLHVLRAHLKIMGLDTGLIDSAIVVKMGGIIKTGSVVGKVDLTKEPPVRKKHYEAILARIGEEKGFRLIVGFEKVLASYENDLREKERIFGYLVRPHLGNPERVTVYFVNRDLISGKTLNELREHCTRVLTLDKRPCLEVLKSLNIEEYGAEIKF